MRRCLTAPRAAPKSDTREYSSLPIDGAPLGPGCRHPTHLLEGSRTVAPALLSGLANAQSVRVFGVEVATDSGPEGPSLQVTVEVGEERLRAQPLLPQPPASHPELRELLPRDGGVELGHPVGHGAEVDLVSTHTQNRFQSIAKSNGSTQSVSMNRGMRPQANASYRRCE